MRRSRSKVVARVRAAKWAAVTLAVASPLMAEDVFWTGSGNDSQWFTAGNWSPHLPGAGDNAFNQSSDSIAFNNTSSASVFSFTDSGSLSILSGNLQGTDPASTLQVDGTFLIDGGTLANFHVLRSSPISFSTGSANVLSSINTDTDLQLQASQQVHIQNGLTLGTAATATLAAGSLMYLDGSQSITGGTITNQGTISANSSGSAVTLRPSTFSNAGTLQANSGTVLTLSSSLDNTGGTITIGDQSALSISSATITRGNINSTGTGKIIPTNDSNNSITLASVNANLDLSNGGRLRLNNCISNVQNSTVNNGAILTAQGPGSITSGTITLGTSGTQQISVEASGTLYVATGATIHGGNAILGVPIYTSGSSTIGNAGLISADVSGSAITISPNRFDNDNGGIVQAINGATINITPTGTDNPNSATYLASGAGSTMNLGGQILHTINAPIKILDNARINIINGSTIYYGTYTASGGGALSASSNPNNLLYSPTINAPLDLSNGGKLILEGGNVSLQSSVLDHGAALAMEGNPTFAAGTLQFGTTSGTQYLSGEAGSTLTIASGATIHGGNAIIGTNLYHTGTASMSNHGLISADVSGAAITIQYNAPTVVANPGTIQAINGGILNLNVGVYQLGVPDGTIHAGANSTVNFNGVTIDGGFLTGPGELHFNNSFNNVLNSVSVTNGTLDLTSPGSARVGSGFSGSASLNNGATIAANSAFFSNGTITLGTSGTNAITVEGTSTLTLQSAFTVTGSGIIGSQALTAGTNSLVNHGTISSSGGNLTIQPSTFTSDGNLVAGTGTKITLSNPCTFSGGIVGGDGSVVAQNSVSLSNSLAKRGSGAVAFNSLPSFATGAALSLDQGALIFNYTGSSPVSTIRSWLTTGYNAGSWNGGLIDSSAAASNSNHTTALGYAEASDLGLDHGGTFAGQSIANEAVIIKFTYYGDENLDGIVNLDDFSIFIDGINGLGSGWIYGDFNYDGVIDQSDFSLFIRGFNLSGQPLSELTDVIVSNQSLSAVQKNAMLAVVPEPGMLMLMVPAMGLLAGRRGRLSKTCMS